MLREKVLPGCLQVVEVERDKLEILGILVGLKDDLWSGVGDVFVVGVEHLKNVLCSEKTMEGGRKRAKRFDIDFIKEEQWRSLT